MPSAQGVEPIVVEGNRRVEAETIRSYFRAGPGERLDAASIDEALKALYATGLFQDVRITPVRRPADRHRGREPGHQPRRLRGQQEAQGRAARHRGAVASRAARCRGRRCRPTCSASSKSTGATAASTSRVDPKIIELPNNRVDLVFEINEGDKTGVRKIIFVGNNSYSATTRLKDEIKTSETIPLIGVPADRRTSTIPTASRPTATCCAASISRRATPTCASSPPSRSTIRTQKGFIVTFTIDEGQRYRFGKVEIQSERCRPSTPKSLYGRLRASAGRRLQRRGGRRSRSRICRSRWRGAAIRSRSCVRAATATWRPRPSTSPSSIEEGPRVYIERINIRGNTRTRDYVIRREFDIAEGDAYNRALIDRAERRLKNLNYFKIVKITNEPGSAPDRIVHQRRCRRAGDRRILDCRRLFDRRRLHGRSQRRRAQPARPRPVRQGVGAIRPARPRLRAVVRRAVFPRLSAAASASTSSPGRRWPRATIPTTARRSARRCAPASR